MNPNIPWKTRGNAALSARFGLGRGPRRKVGEVAGRAVAAFARGDPLPAERAEEFRAALWDRVLADSELEEPGTDPALVVADRLLPSSVYWRTVREVVAPEVARSELERAGAWWRTRGSDRGLVGAAAAIAWPGRRATWELTSYRAHARRGRLRSVDAASVHAAAGRHPALFLCEDPRTRRLLVAPHTACPVLFGLRARRPGPLLRARTEIRSEPVDRWMLFRTNQASGDHLAEREPSDLGPFMSARLRATVAAPPEVLPGGHVRLRLRAREGSVLDCLAFEPT